MDVFCSSLYIQPHGCKFASEDPYLEIQMEIYENCSDLDLMILFGDINSRTGFLPDYTLTDKFI